MPKNQSFPSPKLTPEIVRRIRYIYLYDRMVRRRQGRAVGSYRLRKNMADRVYAWYGIRVCEGTIKAIFDGRSWRDVKVRVREHSTHRHQEG